MKIIYKTKEGNSKGWKAALMKSSLPLSEKRRLIKNALSPSRLYFKNSSKSAAIKFIKNRENRHAGYGFLGVRGFVIKTKTKNRLKAYSGYTGGIRKDHLLKLAKRYNKK